MSRLSPPDPSTLSEAQKAVYDAILTGPRGRVRGPLAIWLHSPDLAQRAQELGAFCRYGTSLPPRLSELAILVTAVHWRSGFEWAAHAPAAAAAGLASGHIEALRRGDDPDFTAPDEQAIFIFARQLLQARVVSQPAYDRIVELLGVRGAVDLTGLLGYYSLISMTINVFEIAPADGAPDPFAL